MYLHNVLTSFTTIGFSLPSVIYLSLLWWFGVNARGIKFIHQFGVAHMHKNLTFPLLCFIFLWLFL